MIAVRRWGRALVLGLTLALAAPMAAGPAHAQQFNAEGEPTDQGGGGDKPLWGYLGAGFATVGILFIICISARR